MAEFESIIESCYRKYTHNNQPFNYIRLPDGFMDGEVEELLNGINNRIFLPGLQREFVWNPNQIESLFDSLVREYPVGIITIWKTRSGSVDNYTTYRFLRSYIASDHQPPNEMPAHFSSYNEREEQRDPEFLIIDGQQRLNSLYIGVCGEIVEYSGGQGRKSQDIENWEVSTLCVDLFGHPNYTGRSDIRGDYAFEFRSTGELGGKDKTGYEERAGNHSLWVPISAFWIEDTDGSESGHAMNSGSFRSDIIDPYVDNAPISNEALDKNEIELARVAGDVARDIHDSILTAELDTNSIKKEGDHIPEIFQRLNREGENPQPYQLFMSQLMSYWPYLEEEPINPREKIRDWVQMFKSEYPEYEQHIDRKLFVRYSAYLINYDLLHSSINELSKDDMDKLHERWTHTGDSRNITGYDWFKKSLEKAFDTIINSGIRYKVMNTMPLFPLLGVFYYENPEAKVEENVNEVFYFISKSLLLEQAGYSVLGYGKCRNWRRDIYNWDSPDGQPILFPGDELLGK
ncbi:DUF262 domain-containing protein [Halorubrum sp. AJ67]|uniref:DUF262 domain-containing protein n=1 Tax=Halorubrum sp. AJ67 TaxID=1173487 RepID=UPI0003DD47BA|nr:DUF262 domain-containing protein [Halorubrum sp. AJ67]CDK39851.1 uncharacterized protein BN903_90 [Halorubrum sp. AJ67]